MKDNHAPKPIKRENYQPPLFFVDNVSLLVCVHDEYTEIDSTLSVRRDPAQAASADTPLHLDGVDLELMTIALDGQPLAPERYALQDEGLSIFGLPDKAELRLVNRINPKNNKSLEGMFLSGASYCTQCEAQGFRKITWFPDRPDVLSRFQVRIEADRQKFPVLLSNGNRTAQGELNDGRHFVAWDDPHPKPSYLFALVAGDLEVLTDRFSTCSGREVLLEIYVEAHNLDKCDYAMQALKASMAWDETTYGLEYDLDRFMIVAVDDFNMGAMENKGLNIFNSRYVLADQATATDSDFMGVEAVIAHEYFHNWTGNRVTCRDWFQLSLKEGLTVFRDQQFSADQNSSAVKRIEDVRLLRQRQFPEDAGPMAHPVRPDEYIEINNFYTVTVYEKGAEVIRMMHTLLGADAYRAGIDLYFKRFDGMAVTCDDFVQVMQDASGVNLDQFRRWYSQAGTPLLEIKTHYDQESQVFTLTVAQSCQATPGQPDKEPFHIPLIVALFDSEGGALPLRLGSDESQLQISSQDPTQDPTQVPTSAPVERLLNVTDQQQSFDFHGVKTKPVPSVLRGFSAPVSVDLAYQDDDLAFLMAHDTDSFNRWDAGQRLYRRVIEALVDDPSLTASEPQFDALNHSFTRLVAGDHDDPSLLAEALSLPGIEAVAEHHPVIRVDELHRAICTLKKSLATRNQEALLALASSGQDSHASGSAFLVNSEAIGQRKLNNVCLSLLSNLPSDIWLETVAHRYSHAETMTDRIAALQILCDSDSGEREQALADFYQQWKHERLVLDKWFALQSMSTRSDTVEAVYALTRHPAFELENPNRARSVLGVFASSNPLRFHDQNGTGYRLVADFVLQLDQFNPQVAARLAVPLGRWQRFDTARQSLMQEQLRRLGEHQGLSADVYEIVTRSLED